MRRRRRRTDTLLQYHHLWGLVVVRGFLRNYFLSRGLKDRTFLTGTECVSLYRPVSKQASSPLGFLSPPSPTLPQVAVMDVDGWQLSPLSNSNRGFEFQFELEFECPPNQGNIPHTFLDAKLIPG